MPRWPMVRSLALLGILLSTTTSAAAQTLVYALETGRDVMCSTGGCHPPTIHLYNSATARELATIVVGSNSERGTALELTSDGATLLVTTTAGRLWIVDAVNRTVVAQLAVGQAPSDIALLPDNSRAYVLGSGAVTVVDLAARAVTATIPFQSSPSRSAVSPTGSAVYVTVPQSAAVAKISTTTNSVDTTIAVGPSPSGIDISPDGSRIFVANNGNATVSVIDANLDSVLRVIPAGSSSTPPVDVAAQSATRVFVALNAAFPAQAEVQLLNAADGALVGASPIGNGGRFARDASGTPVYLVETAGSALRHIAADASSSTTLATATSPPGAGWNDAAVFTDPCSFESTAAPAAFGPEGGSGTLTIAAPPGCTWTIDTSGNGVSVSGPQSGIGPATRTFSVSSGDTPLLATVVIGRQTLTLERTIPRMNIDTPPANATIQQQSFTIAGWAIDQNLGGPPPIVVGRARGIDFLHVWAYPASGASPIFLGTAVPSVFRPDVQSIYGMAVCGFNFTVNGLAAGIYTIVLFAHSEITNRFVTAQGVTVTVAGAGPPLLVVDTPAASATITGAFDVGGWAIDPAAPGGSGVDTVHVWAYPVTGAAPMFLGAAAKTQRPDVADYFKNPTRLECGFLLRSATLPPGTYDLVVFAHSTVTNTFNNSKVVRIAVR